MAMENNREVMAVPGKIDSPLSKGTHRLIKQGAKLIESVEDVMEALGYIGEQLEEHVSEAAQKAAEKINTPLFEIKELKLSGHEKKIFECLNKEPLHIEQIINDTDLAAGSVNASLVSLRLKGLVQQLPGSLFVRR
jgi:DNA processing protein